MVSGQSSISLHHILAEPAILDRLARELYDDYRAGMLVYAGGSESFLLPWDHPGNSHQRSAFKDYTIALCKAFQRLQNGEGPRPTPSALREFDKKLTATPEGCCG